MKILHETVQPIPHLPFKYYEHTPGTPIDVAPHWHQGLELNYLAAGETLKFVTAGQTNLYAPGALWAVNRRVVHSASGNPAADWDEFGLIIDDDFLQSQVPASTNWQLTLAGSAAKETHPQAYAAIIDHLVKMRHLLHAPNSDLIRLQILSEFFALLAQLGQHFTTTLSTTVTANQSLVDTVITYVNQHYADDLTGTKLADQFHVSLTTLNQQFNTNVQLSINRYIRQVRLLNARRLLLESNRTIDYIASVCGFTNAKTFNRNFKHWKHLTPSEYRQAYARYHQIDTNCF